MREADYMTPREAAEVAGVSRQYISCKCQLDPAWRDQVVRISSPHRESAAITLIPRPLVVAYAATRASQS